MPTEIKPGVYDITTRHRDGRRYRVYLFDDDVPTLVDTGHADTTDTLFEKLETLGIEPERLLITHGDGDHIDGAEAIVERYGVETYVPEGEAFDSAVEPDVRYSDGDRIGNFTAVSVPGHTPHHHALVHEDARIAVLGDAVFGSDLRGLPSGYFVLPPAVYSEDLIRADEALETLLEYDFEIALLYHGSSVMENAHEKLEKFVRFPGKP
jgi:glyoxylase-like metal-dependent hydrolase (beta-lactamase superfamily II)